MNTVTTEQTETTARRRWGLRDAIGSLAAFILISIGVSLGLTLAGVHPVTATIIATPAGWIALAGWPLVATRRRGEGARLDLDLRFRSVDVGYGLGAAFVLFAAGIVFVTLYLAIAEDVPTSTLGNVAEASTEPWQILVLIALALGAAFVEELHFRGFWWNALRRLGVGKWATWLITSAVFSLIHLELFRAPLLFAAGLAAGYVRMVTGRLGPAIVAHLVINGVATIGLWSLL